jgi:hypothetical protein
VEFLRFLAKRGRRADLDHGTASGLPAYAEMSLDFSESTGSVLLLAFSAAVALGRVLPDCSVVELTRLR